MNLSATVPDVNAIVLGANGQLGSELVRLIGRNAGVTHSEVSVTDQKSLDALLSGAVWSVST